MKLYHFTIPIVATILIAVVSIAYSFPFKKETPSNQQNAVYYWRTTFRLNEVETQFLQENNIKKMYVRFFDVEPNKYWKFRDNCAPVATIEFYDTVPKFVEIVPVVFIKPEAIVEYQTFTDNMAHRLYAMCQYHNISINEVQFDCDWTGSTREAFFQFLKEIRKSLNDYFQKEIKISSTIRLHQLAQIPPDVDYGVLMCYNTGNFKDFKTENSILDIKDVKPYLKYLKSYDLPLTLGLPTYEWSVAFNNDKEFYCLNFFDYDDLQDTVRFKCLGGNCYERLGDYYRYLSFVRYEKVSAETILQVKDLIRQKYGKMPVALYHLDSKQLSKYSKDEIEAFFD